MRQFADSFATQSSKTENNLRQKYNKILFDVKPNLGTVFDDGVFSEKCVQSCVLSFIVQKIICISALYFLIHEPTLSHDLFYTETRGQINMQTYKDTDKYRDKQTERYSYTSKH